MKRHLLVAVAMSGLALGASATELVVNGGFELGSFTGWSSTGNNIFDGVQCPGPSSVVRSGNCSGFFGPLGAESQLSQSLATVAGGLYAFTFSVQGDGGSPSHFAAKWNGVTILNLNPVPGTFLGPYTDYYFAVTATGANTPIEFDFRDDPGFINFDAVSVQTTPEPGSMILLGTGLVGAALLRRRKQA